MFAAIWPFDFSCSGFFCVLVTFLGFLVIGLAQAASKAAGVAKDVLQSDIGKEVGKDAVESWIDSWFR